MIICIPCPDIDTAGQGREGKDLLEGVWRMPIPSAPGSTWDSPEQLRLPGLSAGICLQEHGMDGCELSLRNSALSCAHRAGSCGPAPNSSRVLERGSGIQPDPSAQVVICGFFPLCGTTAPKVFVASKLHHFKLCKWDFFFF